jgi:hypothetical protein
VHAVPAAAVLPAHNKVMKTDRHKGRNSSKKSIPAKDPSICLLVLPCIQMIKLRYLEGSNTKPIVTIRTVKMVTRLHKPQGIQERLNRTPAVIQFLLILCLYQEV